MSKNLDYKRRCLINDKAIAFDIIMQVRNLEFQLELAKEAYKKSIVSINELTKEINQLEKIENYGKQ